MKLFQGISFFSQLLRIKLTGRGRPLTVIFNLSNRCNLRCVHCYAAYHARDTAAELTTAQVKAVLADLRQNGCLRVSFSGGEPLLRVDLEEIIDDALGLGLSVTVNTNGLLVPQRLALLKKVDALAISLDGCPEHHDVLRGAGVGERVVRAIEQAVQAGIRVHTNTVINRHNLGDIDYVLALARRLGIKAEFALAIAPITTTPGQEDVRPDTAAVRAALRDLIQKKKTGAPILFSSAGYERVLKRWDDSRPAMPDCPAGRIFCIIEADGTLCACPHLLADRQVRTANVLRQGVAQAWRIAGQHACRSCYQVYHHEFALLQNLDPRVIANYIRQLF